MGDFKEKIEGYLESSAHLSKKHVHPRLLKMFELGGMHVAFTKAQGQYMWDAKGDRYLDLLAGGGVYFMGRNNPLVKEMVRDVLEMDLPNLSVVNASALGGLLAGRLIELAGDHYGKVVFANSGSESNEVALRFARQVTKRRRYLYLEGAFHGRSYGAVSVCGFKEMRKDMAPAMPTCTPIRPNDIRQLRRELAMGDVAGFIFEPVQGMTGRPLEAQYLREAQNLCEEHGTVMIADEVQTGLGRTGAWFACQKLGVRPHIMTLSKALSGGMVPVGAVLVNNDIYDMVYSGFSSGLVYFSTFAENNLAMAAGLASLEALEGMNACEEAERKGQLLADGLNELKERYDCIEEVTGMGLMRTVYFRDSSNLVLAFQQKAMKVVDTSAFAAAIHVDLFKNRKIIAQLPGPGVNAVKVLPPVMCTDEDINYFVSSLGETLKDFYGNRGPIVSLSEGVVEQAGKMVRSILPGASSAK